MPILNERGVIANHGQNQQKKSTRYTCIRPHQVISLFLVTWKSQKEGGRAEKNKIGFEKQKLKSKTVHCHALSWLVPELCVAKKTTRSCGGVVLELPVCVHTRCKSRPSVRALALHSRFDAARTFTTPFYACSPGREIFFWSNPQERYARGDEKQWKNLVWPNTEERKKKTQEIRITQ